MAEEFRMDKKSSNRSFLQQSRLHAVDNKKGDVAHKPCSRNNRKRDIPSSIPKNEPVRKNAFLTRGRGAVDKRTRSREDTNQYLGGAQSTRLEEINDPEIGSVLVPGSKKQNLSHLLNFSYPSRALRGTDRGPALRRQGQNRISIKHKNDSYLRSHSQFVMKEGDYEQYLLDPDLPMKWDHIEEIVVRSTGKSECPICLGTPVAGRVSICGHVYCWACVLHYSEINENQSPPCPVCTTSLQVAYMKPARIVQWKYPTDKVTMMLVRRLRGSTFVELAPSNGVVINKMPRILPLESLEQSPFNKLFSATKQQIINILERDKKEIKNQIMAEIDTTEIQYLERALQMLDLKEKNIKEQSSPLNEQNIVNKEITKTIYENSEVVDKKLDWFDEDEATSSIDMVVEDISALNLDNQSTLNPSAKPFQLEDDKVIQEFPPIECKQEQSFNDIITKQNQAKYFYFYQAADGQQVFLHSINVRMLNATWGCLAAAPLLLEGRVLKRDTLSVKEVERKHAPCIAHLPLESNYEIVELDLKPPFVTSETLAQFSDALEHRARQRAKKEREDRRRERAQRRALEGPPNPDISSSVLFPPALNGSPPYNNMPLILNEPQPSTSGSSREQQTSPQVDVASPSGLSFAMMASVSGTWSVRKAQPPVQLTSDAEDNDVLPPRNLILSDAIEAALQASNTSKSSSKKNKKKTKHTVLFATGMPRSG